MFQQKHAFKKSFCLHLSITRQQCRISITNLLLVRMNRGEWTNTHYTHYFDLNIVICRFVCSCKRSRVDQKRNGKIRSFSFTRTYRDCVFRFSFFFFLLQKQIQVHLRTFSRCLHVFDLRFRQLHVTIITVWRNLKRIPTEKHALNIYFREFRAKNTTRKTLPWVQICFFTIFSLVHAIGHWYYTDGTRVSN